MVRIERSEVKMEGPEAEKQKKGGQEGGFVALRGIRDPTERMPAWGHMTEIYGSPDLEQVIPHSHGLRGTFEENSVIPVNIRIPSDSDKTCFPTIIHIHDLDSYRTVPSILLAPPSLPSVAGPLSLWRFQERLTVRLCRMIRRAQIACSVVS